MTQRPLKPTLFDENDQTLTIKETPPTRPPEEWQEAHLPTPPPGNSDKTSGLIGRLTSLSFWLISSLFGLLMVWGLTNLIQAFETLITRGGLLGWAALTLGIIALTSFTLLLLRQITGLWGLKKLAHLKAEGQSLYEDNQIKPTRKYIAKLKSLYAARPELSWNLKRFTALEGEIMDGRELIDLADKEIGSPLDEKARGLIIAHARKVSLITALAPGPLLDMAAVALINLRMIRKIAALYGINPGLWGQWRLAQKVITQITLSGGLALTGDLIQPLIGTSLAAKFSKKFGEGIFNGGLTIRLGLSAIELTRPLPHTITKPLAFRDLAAASLKPTGSGQ